MNVGKSNQLEKDGISNWTFVLEHVSHDILLRH